jgi:hypothetical protein
MVSLVSFLDENARRQPDHLACVVGDDSLSYAELRDASCRADRHPRPPPGRRPDPLHRRRISGYDHAVCTVHVLTAT